MNEDEERRRFQNTLDRVPDEAIEPSPGEAKNGWTAETLTPYIQEQRAAQSLRIDPHGAWRRTIPTSANSKYSPFRWRK